jgi:hypothetical protein
MEGSIIEPRKDLRVYFAPSTRTAEMLSGVCKFPETCSYAQDIEEQKMKNIQLQKGGEERIGIRL